MIKSLPEGEGIWSRGGIRTSTMNNTLCKTNPHAHLWQRQRGSHFKLYQRWRRLNAMAKATQGTNTQSYGQSNTTLTTRQCLQKEPKYELGISQPSCKELQHFTTHTMELKNENKWALMAAEKPDSANPNPRRRMRKLGLRGKLLKHPLNGGGCSTCPPKY